MRITRHMAFMQTAEVWSRRSTCFRRNVGAVLAAGPDTVATAYNGPPPGEEHCTGKTCPTNNVCTRSIHAETNAINRYEGNRADLILYVTESPCMACAARIVDFKRIIAVYYMHTYRDPAGVDYLAQHLPVFRMTPAGDVIEYLSGERKD